jgi:LysR family transcriptional regulator, nod-box dependent transcriptional activator
MEVYLMNIQGGKIAIAGNFRHDNLNSLPVLREILRHGSIARAAEVLHLTLPALRNTLRQLRGYFGDELIGRQGREMRLTLKAEAVLQPLKFALSSVQDVSRNSSFDAAYSTEQFQIAMTDHSMSLLAAPFTAIISKEGPQMQARFVGVSNSIVADFAGGKIDMIVCPGAILTSDHFNAMQLARERTEHLCAEQHPSMEQADLASLGYRQHDRITLASYLLLPAVVAKTGCLSLVPLSVAEQASHMHPIQFVEPPIKIPEFEQVMVWHERDEANPGSKWLREMLKRFVSMPKNQALLSRRFGT